MNLAALTIRNSRTSLVLYVVVMLLGVRTYLMIGRLEYPEFTIRNAQIITTYSGRTAAQVEQEVTEPIEQAVRQMQEVRQVRSTSKSNLSIVMVELQEDEFDLQPTWQRMRNKVGALHLPDGAGVPQVNDEFGDVFPYIYALVGDGYTDRELVEHGEVIRDALLEVDGVAKVEFHGEREERVFVEFSSSELASRGLSPTILASELSLQNSVASSGSVAVGVERANLLTRGEFDSIEDIQATRLSVPGDSTSILLEDLATIRHGYLEPRRDITHQNGERALGIAISMVEGGIVTEIGQRIEQALDGIRGTLPIGLEVEPVFLQPVYVDASIRSFIINLGQAFFFVALVMWLFAGWRIAVIVSVLVPSAVLMSFAFMPAFGVQLEMMSIAALIIALGLLVDNAVVVSEQVLVRLGDGSDRFTACTESIRGLSIPLLAASATTVAAFSPIALAPGSISEFTYSLFAVVTLTLMSSWLLSMTIIPLLCYALLVPLERDTWVGRALTLLYGPYERGLRRAIRLRWVFPVAILVATIVSGWGFGLVPNIFFPPNERGQFIIDFELPLGRDIEETERRVSELETWLLGPEGENVRSVSSWVGSGGPRWYLSLAPEPPNPNYAFMTVLTESSDPQVVHSVIERVNRHARRAFPDARVTAKALENGPPVGAPIQIRIYGREAPRLYACRDQIAAILSSTRGLVDVRDDWGAWVKQIAVDPDPIRAARLGLRTSDIATALKTQYQGLAATTLRVDDRAIPVVLRSREDYRDRPERLQDLPVYGSEGGFVPLAQVADVSLEFVPGSILREDTLRVMTVKAQVEGRYAIDALDEIRPRVEALVASDTWPSDCTVEFGGEQEESADAQKKIAAVLPISMAILALILIAQFNSMRRFIIIMLSIPPMLVGITPGLLITGSTFGFMTLLGIIALLGIVVNNAILLIDAINEEWRSRTLVDAVVVAARSRLRPIVMTTVTTIIGLLPLAISGGGMWSSMANAMMFGLGFATVLTLVLCPVLFSILFVDPSDRGIRPDAPVEAGREE
ncbi:MAG: efflux RND transporter permease subunit [Planctomycetes bacterium]|nr:efflux RND transporter permease subunit [Planctomycetota bacterium]